MLTILLLVLASPPEFTHTGERARVQRTGGRDNGGGSVPYVFCDVALTAANRVGTWGCINGDATAATGDNFGPWVATGSPTPTVGTRCSAPSYQTLHTANPSERYESTATLAAVGTAFTWCAVYEETSTLKAAFFWGSYPCCAAYAMTVERGTTVVQYATGGVGNDSTVSVATEKTLVCGSWTTPNQNFYIRNSAVSSYKTLASAPVAAAGYKLTFGADADIGGTKVNGKFYGGFFTQTVLNQAALDVIYEATIGSGCL